MSAVLTPPAPQAVTPLPTARFVPRPYLWTVDEFHRVASTGLFGNRRPILIRGAIVEQGPMNPPHAQAISFLTDTLRAAFPTGWLVRMQLPLTFGLHTDPIPDAAVVTGTARDYPTHPTTAALVVEISDTTLSIDLTDKAELYATAGIPDYWVLDLDNRQLIVFRDPQLLPASLGATAYRTRLSFGPTDTAFPLAAPTSAVRVADLLP